MELDYSPVCTLECVFQKLPQLVEKLEFFMREAIRTAHIAHGITPDVFVRGMLLMGGTGGPKQVTLGSGITLDAGGDPYRQLDLQTCLKYLCCGGLRIVSESGDPLAYATDQDAFFDHFGVDCRYEVAPARPCRRLLKAGEFGSAMLRLYRILTEGDPESPCSLYSRKALSYKLRALIGVLQPLCDTRWAYAASCIRLMRVLVKSHFRTIDAENELICSQRKGGRLYRKGGTP